MSELPTIHLKTRDITFDDRLQQVRVLKKNKKGQFSHGMKSIEFLNYRDDEGYRLVRKYRQDWADIIKI